MDLGQLEAFLRVAEQRSFSRAAGDLGLTQPSVTARIQALERDLGESIFERDGRGVRLTDVGASFLPHARRVLKSLQDGRDAVQSVRQLERGTLRVGAAPTISTYVLPDLLMAFRARYPQLEVAVHTEHSEQIAQMVLTDEVQVGLERSITHPEVVTVPLYSEEVVLVTAPGHPFAARGSATIEEVSRQPLIMFNRQSGYYALVHGALHDAGILPSPTMELDNMEATKQMVRHGLGIAMLPRAAVEPEVSAGDLMQVGVEGMTMPRREIALIFRRGRPLSRAAQVFVKQLEERYGVKAPPAEPDA